MKFLRRSLIMMIALLMVILVGTPGPAFAAVNEDFESYSDGTLAEALTTPGASFNGGGLWQVVEAPIFVTLTGMVLLEPGSEGGPAIGPLTISFDSPPQSSFSFNFVVNWFTEEEPEAADGLWADEVPAFNKRATPPTKTGVDAPAFGPNIRVQGYLDGAEVFDLNFAAGDVGGIFAEGVAAYAGASFDTLVISNEETELGIDNLVTTDASPEGSPCANYSWLGLVQIGEHQYQPAYGFAGSTDIARGLDGVDIYLPADFDGNGFDTYVVTSIQLVGDEYWLGLFLGGCDYGFVPLSGVTQLKELALP